MPAQPIILCVDDEQIILDTLASQLQLAFGKECRIELAQNIKDAWEILEEIESEQNNIRLVISDNQIPPDRGDIFLQNIYAKFPHIKLILLSGATDTDTLVRMKSVSSLLSILRKPWEKNELIGLVKSAIGKS